MDTDMLVGNGIYSLSDASFITGIHHRKINRWIKGYRRKEKFFDPVLDADYEPIEKHYSISFLDLIELFFVNAFMEHGVSLQTIRKTYEKAQEYTNFEHPFSTLKFKTDGKIILAEIDDKVLLNLLNNQLAIKKILDPFFTDVLEFDNNVVNKYWPLGKDRQVVLDPNRSFGKPIVNREGVPVMTLVNAYKAEGSIKGVAEWYEVSNESVQDAVDYYHKLAA
jgi:uncharacterized protein (DUF433 family)